MVALKTEPLTDNLSIGQLAKYDSKANMLDTFRLIGVGVTKSWDKSSLATCMDMVFEQTPALFANILPKDERNLRNPPYERKVISILRGTFASV